MTFVIAALTRMHPRGQMISQFYSQKVGEVGQSGALHGYLTKDGRLWLYKDDAEIQRLSHSVAT